MRFIGLSWLVVALSFLHPFYISMTEVNYNKKSGTVEVSVRIFTDDLEKAMRKKYRGRVDLMNRNDTANSGKLLQAYIPEQLMFRADGRAMILKFIGFEIEGGSTWSYFEATGIRVMNTIEVTNKILYDYQDKQVNFIHIKANNADETVKLEYPESYKKFTVN